jgi:hypothetical protein
MAYVSVPKDLTKVKTKFLFNLTKRQVICFGIGILMGVPLFFILRNVLPVSAAAMIMIVVMLPAFMFAMFERNGQPLEKVLWNIINVLFLRPKQRPYRTNNFYAVIERQQNLDKEVSAIVQKQAVPRRQESDSGGNRKGKPHEPQRKVRAGQHTLSANVGGRHLSHRK